MVDLHFTYVPLPTSLALDHNGKLLGYKEGQVGNIGRTVDTPGK